MEHAAPISKLLGFSGVGFSFGPYFSAPGKGDGVQIDLLFDREDNVLTLCETKYSQSPPGISLVQEVERKVQLLQNKFPKKTIQKVLIALSPPTRDLMASGYFYQVIHPEELLD